MMFSCFYQEDFDRYKCIWEDCGFETYYGNNKEYIANDINDDPFTPQ